MNDLAGKMPFVPEKKIVDIIVNILILIEKMCETTKII
jgi:hypothetical protein